MKYKIVLRGIPDDPDSISEIRFSEKKDWTMFSIVVSLAIEYGLMKDEDVDFITGVYYSLDNQKGWTQIPGITESHYGVHETHCCMFHGCKYGDTYECPVERRKIKQEHPCEDCDAGHRQALFGKGDTIEREYPFYD